MFIESFSQDVRVGLRVLFKEKSFCFLAVLVLGLGIMQARRRAGECSAARCDARGALMIGLVIGAGTAALLLGVLAAAALQNILFKVNALDPFIYFVVAGLLTVVAALSCFVPARRATRVDPMVALRYE